MTKSKKFASILAAMAMLVTSVTAFADEQTNLQKDYEALTRAKINPTGVFGATLTDDLVLPSEGDNGSTITWVSDNEGIISQTGVVTRGELTKSVALTATLSDGENTMEKVFSFRVPDKYDTEYGGKATSFNGFSLDDGIAPNYGKFAGTFEEATVKINGRTRDCFTARLDGVAANASLGRLYIKTDKSSIDELSSLEFHTIRNNYNLPMLLTIEGSKANPIMFEWGVGQISYYDKDGRHVIKDADVAKFGEITTEAKFRIDFNSILQKYTLYINGIAAVTDAEYYNSGKNSESHNINAILIKTSAVAPNTGDYFAIDYVKEMKLDYGETVTDEQFESAPTDFTSFNNRYVWNNTKSVSGGYLNYAIPKETTYCNAIYFTDDQSSIPGNVAFETKLHRNVTSPIAFRFYGDAGNINSQVTWNNDNLFINGGAANLSVKNTDTTAKTPYGDFSTDVTLKLIIDYTNKTIKYVVNGVLAGEATFYKSGSDAGLGYSTVHPTSSASANVLRFDYFKVTKLSAPVIGTQEVSGINVDYNAYDQRINVLSENAITGNCIFATYKEADGAKQLVSCDIMPFSAAAKKNALLGNNPGLSEEAVMGKVFIWEGNELKPIAQSTDIPAGSLAAY